MMQKRVLRRALDQVKLKPGDLDYIFAGDLLNQCIGSSFGLREFGVPFYGLYGACSTMGESSPWRPWPLMAASRKKPPP